MSRTEGVAPRRRAHAGTSSGIRVLMGVDATRERALLHALQAAVPRGGGAFHVLRAVTAPELEARLSSEGADAILLGEGLFELSPRTLAVLANPSRPVVLLGAAPGGVLPQGVMQVPAETGAAEICGLLEAAVQGSPDELTAALQLAGVKLPSTGAGISRDPSPPDTRRVRGGKVLVFVGAPRGAAGMSRVTIESGCALGRRDKTLLVDAVPREPSFAAALALNPARNLTAVAAASLGTDPVRWTRALAEWCQPLDESSPHAVVLAGVPTAPMRSRLSPSFLAELLRQASAHGAFAYVVVDGGAEPPPDTFEGACWRALVETADHVLLVTVPDTVGVARAHETLKGLAAAVPRERLGVVLNRYRKGEHDAPDEVAALMGVPVVAVVPQDERACRRALRTQRPLLTLGRGPAAREFQRFADRIRTTQGPAVERWWSRWLPTRLRARRGH